MFESFLNASVVLEHLLAVLDIGVAHFAVCDVRRGWGMRVEAGKMASMHYCLAGSGSLYARGLPPIPLDPHGFVLLPPDLEYRIESDSPTPVHLRRRASMPAAASNGSVPTLIVGDGAQGIQTACTDFRVGLADGMDLFAAMGRPLVVRFDCAGGLKSQFLMLLAESARPGVGSRVLTEALVKQCLILALRRWVEQDASPLPWLAAVADVRLSRVLHAIVEQPAAAHTVDSLALMAGMSRSAFAAAFRRAFGQSPMSLVRWVRLRRARELLITTEMSVAEVTRRVGFASRSNFSAAFSALHGMDPRRFRRTFSVAGPSAKTPACPQRPQLPH